MKKELQEIVDFTNRECVTGRFKSILQDHMGGTGTFLLYMGMEDSEIFVNYEIPFDEIESVEYRYCDRIGDRIERGYFNSIDELKKWVEGKRSMNQMEYSDFYMKVPSTYFPFYEYDKIGSAYITITTKREEISIYFPSQKISIEKDWNKPNDENTENEERDSKVENIYSRKRRKFKMKNGVCKWFNPSKGYGFLTSDDGVDTFVHYSQLQMNGFKVLHEGDKVTFDIADCDKGTQAVNVQKIVEE